jgi:multidrug efflux system outer membrane protein
MKFKHTMHVFLISQLIASFALASTPTPSPSVSPSPSASPSASPSPVPTVSLNPDTLRTLLLSENNQILISLQNVHVAKAAVSNARAGLLPSLNISFTGPSFALSAVSFLVPFLIPSNWFALKASEHELTADEAAYYIMELNTYASAYAMYETVVSDLQERDILVQAMNDYQTLESFLEQEASSGVPVTPVDLETAQAQTKAAAAAVSSLDETIIQERFQIGMALGLPPDAGINFDSVDVTASSTETATTYDALSDQAFNMSPEKTQQDAIIAAGGDNKWSALFSFIGSDTVQATSDNFSGGSVDFSTLQDKGSINLGFGIFTSYELSKQDLAVLKLEQTSVSQQMGATVGSTIASIAQAIYQYNQNLDAEQLQQNALLNEVENYQNGSSTIASVVQQQESMTQFSTARVKSHADVNALRITLNRTFLTEQFANIKGCNVQDSSKKQGGWPIFNWIGSIFHPSAGQQTLDQMCKSTT